MIKGEKMTLSEAMRRNLVSTRVTGSGLQSVSLTIKRSVRRPLRIVVPAGTLFECGDGDAQNMVATSDSEADLTSSNTFDSSVSAACANFYLDQPDGNNSFSIHAAHPNSTLRKLLTVIGKNSPRSIVAQLTIWSVTDNPSRAEVASHIDPSPDDDDYRDAATLLKEANIKPSSRRMFSESE